MRAADDRIASAMMQRVPGQERCELQHVDSLEDYRPQQDSSAYSIQRPLEFNDRWITMWMNQQTAMVAAHVGGSMSKSVARRELVGTACLLALAPLGQGGSPQAKDLAQDQSAIIGEVVVTARRREESLQDVPIAVSAVSAESLELRGAPDITDLQRTTPSLTLQVSRGTNSTLTAFIRGVGQQDPLWGFEPGVGLYVDDVYYARPQGAVLDILDIDRIEVLRGPQGTLYGRNTIGGTIKYVTRRLGSDSRLLVRAEGGNYGQLNGVISGALPVSDTVSVGAALGSFNRDGFGKNLNTGAEHGLNKDVLTGRASVEITPTDSLFFRLAYDRVDDKSNPYHGHRELPGIGGTPAVLPGVFDTNAGLTDEMKVETSGYSLLAEWKASDALTFKSISAYREGETYPLGIDFDGTPAPILDVGSPPVAGSLATYKDHQFSQELQAVLTYERWQGIVGAYYLDAMARGAFDTILQNAGFTQGTSGRVDTESYAAFGDFSFDLTDRFSAAIGARWTRDSKDATNFKANYLGLGSPISARNVAPFQILTNYSNSRDFEEVTPRASVTFKANEDFTVYAAYGRGFKSGGFDMRGDAVAFPATVNGYEPEIVDSYEIGLKGRLANGRISFATAVFDQEYQDQQVTIQRPGLTPTSPVVSVVENVGKSRIRGAEVEATATVSDSFQLNLSASYLDAEFLEYITFNPVTRQNEDVADQRFVQNTPEWMGSLGLTYRLPLADRGEIALSGSASYRGSVYLFEVPSPALDQGSYTLYDAGVVWKSATESWQLGIYGRNLTDEKYRTGGYNFAGALFGNSIIGFYGPPRTYLASLTYRLK
jgi:iron complex outermembrane receptor protein